MRLSLFGISVKGDMFSAQCEGVGFVPPTHSLLGLQAEPLLSTGK